MFSRHLPLIFAACPHDPDTVASSSPASPSSRAFLSGTPHCPYAPSVFHCACAGRLTLLGYAWLLCLANPCLPAVAVSPLGSAAPKQVPTACSSCVLRCKFLWEGPGGKRLCRAGWQWTSQRGYGATLGFPG